MISRASSTCSSTGSTELYAYHDMQKLWEIVLRTSSQALEQPPAPSRPRSEMLSSIDILHHRDALSRNRSLMADSASGYLEKGEVFRPIYLPAKLVASYHQQNASH